MSLREDERTKPCLLDVVHRGRMTVFRFEVALEPLQLGAQGRRVVHRRHGCSLEGRVGRVFGVNTVTLRTRNHQLDRVLQRHGAVPFLVDAFYQYDM